LRIAERKSVSAPGGEARIPNPLLVSSFDCVLDLVDEVVALLRGLVGGW
jgi:hypothetical protein